MWVNRLSVGNFQTSVAGDVESFRNQTQLVQHGGVDVGHIVAIFHGVKAQLIGGSVDHTTLDAACRGCSRSLAVSSLLMADGFDIR